MNITDFNKHKQNNKKITVVTCYDYSFAKIIDQTNINCVLVGDTLAMTIHGFEDTTYANIDMMSLHTAAVKRGLSKNQFIIADLPFLSYRRSLEYLMQCTTQLIQNGASAIKLEGSEGNIKYISHLVESGIPVMGHIGLTPQFVNAFGGYRVQGKSTSQANHLLEQAKTLQDTGCFAIVLECIPSQLAKKISQTLTIPTIGIGAGSGTDGQVLVLQDLLGMDNDFNPKFVKKFLDGQQLIQQAINQYCEEVEQEQFPNEKHSFK